MSRLSETELRVALAALPEWRVLDGKLHREYAFEDFTHAFGFMATSALAIEAMNHHPEWKNTWNRVVVDLTTHEAGGITGKDIVLATKMEQVARRLL